MGEMVGKFILFFIISAVVTVPLFMRSIEYFSEFTVNNSSNIGSQSVVVVEELSIETLAQHQLQISECLNRTQSNEYLSVSECYQSNKKVDQKGGTVSSSQKNVDKGRWLIDIIYVLLWFAFNLQITISIYSISNKAKIDQKFFYLSDWSINSAPMLGVMGTIISFTLYFSNCSLSDIGVVFSENFVSAATTTILGGFVYVVSLLQTSIINPKIQFEE